MKPLLNILLKIGRSGLWLLVIITAFILLFVGLLATPQGSRFLIYSADYILEPLSIENPEGAFLSGVSMDSILWSTPETLIEIEALVTQWDLNCFSLNTICLQKLHAAKIDLTLPPSSTANEAEQDNAKPIELPDITLPIALDIDSISFGEVTIRQPNNKLRFNDITLKASAKQNRVDLTQLGLRYDNINFALNGQIKLEGHYPIELTLDVLAEQFIENQHAKLKLTAKGPLNDLTGLVEIQQPQSAKLGFNLNALDPTLPIKAGLDWSNLKWPLDNQPTIATVEQGTINISGDLAKGWAVKANTSIEGPSIPLTHLTLSAQTDTTHIKIQELALSTLDGTVTTSASANWANGITSQWEMQLNNINPAAHWPQLQGQLSGLFAGKFEQTTDAPWQFNSDKIDLTGTWLEKPLALTGEVIASEDKGINIHNMALRNAENTLALSGVVHEQIDLIGQVQFPQLATLWPGLSGALLGDFKTSGQSLKPNIKLNLKGTDIGYQQHQVAALNLQADVTQLGQSQSSLVLTAKDLKLDQQSMSKVSLTFDGQQSNHQIQLKADSKTFSSDLELDGQFIQDSMKYKGHLNQINLTADKHRLNLEKATAFELDLKQSGLKIAAHCWQELPTKLCLLNEFDSHKAAVSKISLNHFSLQKIQPLLPENVTASGEYNATSELTWSPGKKPEIAIRSAFKGLRLDVTPSAEDSPIQYQYQTAKINANSNAQNSLIEIDLQSKQLGNIDLKAKIDAATAEQPTSEAPLSGSLLIEDLNIKALKPFINDIETLAANIKAQGRIAGRLLEPEFHGNLEINEIQLAGDQIPVSFDDGSINVAFQGKQALIKGQLKDQLNQINLNGSASWPLPKWHLKLNLDGDDFPVYIDPYAEAKISPHIKITGNQDRVDVKGSVSIPTARIEIRELPPGAPSPSKDVTIIRPSEDQRSQATTPFPLHVDMTILLGDDIRLSAYGFKSNLSGTVGTSITPSKPPFLSGEVAVVDGLYKSYGQNLIIDEGRIYFGGPIEATQIDAEAYRTIGDVKAGLQLSGALSKPTIELTSSPSMSDDNILSYIVLGRAIGESGETSEATLLTQAALSMGIKNGRGLAGDVAGALGIEDFQLEAAGSGDDSQVVVSGKINDRLSVKYGVGVFKPITEITLKYDITKRLYLNVVQAAANAVDLFYLFEFNHITR